MPSEPYERLEGGQGQLLHLELKAAAEEHPDRTWLDFLDGDSHTFSDVWRDSVRVSDWLQRQGVGDGARVLVMVDNRYEFVVSVMGSLAAGAIALPLNTALRGEVLEHMLATSTPSAAIMEKRSHLVRAAHLVDTLTVAAVIETDSQDGSLPATLSVQDFGSMLAETSADDSACRVYDARNTAMILFTSGTTGPSKGVKLSHSAIGHIAAAAVNKNMRYSADDTVYTCLPLFHGNAFLTSLIPTLQARAQLSIGQRFSASRFWDEVCASQATAVNLLGAMTPILLKNRRSAKEREHRLRIMLVIPCPPEYEQAIRERFGVQPVQAYGLTDFGMLLWQPPNQKAQAGSCGLPTEGYQLAIVDEDDHEVPTGEVGELVARPLAPWISADGYWNNLPATLESRRNLWFHTGDLMRKDSEGWYYFVDRVKDAIRRRGENVSAFEVEHALISHPAVLECAAYALPSELSEDEVAIAVVFESGAGVDPRELIQHVEYRLPYFAVPRYITVMESLPKTSTEKVQKQELRRLGVTGDTWDREQHGYDVSR